MATGSDNITQLAQLFCHALLVGDQQAYANFLQGITPLLHRMVISQCAAADRDDLVQEILISIHKARHTYDGKRPLLPWLAAIAKFRLTDHIRKYYTQRRDKTIDIDGLEEFLPDVTQESVDDEWIDKWLEDVPDHHKRILTLMHVEGYTAKQVGEQLKMNESAVKVAAHRALKKLRKKFGAE